MDKLIIRKMVVEDLDEVVSIATLSPSNAWSKNIFLEEISSPISQCFIIRWIEILVGFICFRIIGEESELLNMGVHPKFRRLGFGKELMNFYLEHCKKMKVKRYYLEVCTSNHPAIQLYSLFSFKTLGVRKKLYQGRWDAFLMGKEI